jgi:hypothetical protein
MHNTMIGGRALTRIGAVPDCLRLLRSGSAARRMRAGGGAADDPSMRSTKAQVEVPEGRERGNEAPLVISPRRVAYLVSRIARAGRSHFHQRRRDD